MKHFIMDILDAGGYTFRDLDEVEKVLENSKYKYNLNRSLRGELKAVEGDMDINDILNEIKPFVKTAEEKDKEQEQEQKAREERQRQIDAEASKVLVTSGFNFEGHSIVRYSGYISGDDAIEIPRGGIFGKNNGQNLTDALVQIRIRALYELKMAAADLGCNAVIGVDFDYITLEPETIHGTTHYYEPYVICVTANGTAVKIVKERHGLEIDESIGKV